MGETTAQWSSDAATGWRALADPRYELIPIGGMLEQARRLPAGATIAVTCSPRHGIETTLAAAEALRAEGYHAIPHVAARLVRSHEDLQRILERLERAGLRDVFVVGGDAPAPAGPYPGGLELLRAIAASGPRPSRIGVPAYPEPHASIPSHTLRAAYRAKAELADYAVTQICFDAGTILEWLARERDGGGLPVHVGLPGVIDRKRLLGLAVRIGLGASTRVLRRQAGLASRLLGGGTYRPADLVQALAPAFDGPEGSLLHGFHINTFNQVEATRAWIDQTVAAACEWRATPATAAASAVPGGPTGY